MARYQPAATRPDQFRNMSDLVNLLIVDDSADDAELISIELENNGLKTAWQRVDNQSSLLAAYEKQAWNIVLCDIRMPFLSPEEVLEITREYGDDIPVILISGIVHEKEVIRLFMAGARDFLSKESLARLPMAIRREMLEHASRQARRKAEQRIKEQESHLRSLLDAMAEGLVVIDKDGRCTMANPASVQLLGYNTAHELVGKALHPRIHHSDKNGRPCPIESCALFNVLKSGQSYIGTEEYFWRQDGSGFPVRCQAVTLWKEEKISGAVITFWDISEEQLAAQALKESESHFRSVTESAIDAIISADAKGYITFWNKGAWMIFGYMAHEIIGRPLTLLMPETFRAQHTYALNRADKNNEMRLTGQVVELVGLHKNGQEFPIEVSLSSWKVNGKRYFSSIVRNITKRKKDELKIIRQKQSHQALYQLLERSLGDIPLSQQLELALDLVLSGAWVVTKNKGAIFLWDDKNQQLVRVAHRGIEEPILSLCEKVAPGQCLCGLAIKNQELIYSAHVDERHTIQYEGMKPHGHYCIPILTDGPPLGLITLYLPEGHHRDKEEETFFKSMAATLAGIINRHRAEEKLHILNQRYRLILGTTAEGYWLIDPITKKTIEVNQSLCQMLGYSYEEMIGCTPFDFVDEKNRKIFKAQTAQINEVDHRRYEITLQPKTGQPVHTIFNATTLHNEKGEVTGAFAFVTDITQRKEAEKALQNQYDFSESLVNTAPAIILVLDKDGNIVRFNPYMESLSGYSLNEVRGKSWYDTFLLAAEDSNIHAVLHDVEYAHTKGKINYITLKDGKTRLIEWYETALHDTEEKIVGLLAIGQDITERYKSEEARLRLLSIIESAKDFIAFADVDGNTIYINHAGQEMIGLAYDEDFSLLKMADYYSREAFEHLQKVCLPTAIREGAWEGETEFLTRSKKKIPISQILVSHHSPAGNLLYFSTIARNITDRKKTEAELREAHDTARIANQAKSEFLAAMSHEIRTPLNAILGMGELLDDTQLTETQSWCVQTLSRAGETLLTLINDILDLSKIEAGRLKLDITEFDLRASIEETIDLFSYSALEKGIQLFYQIEPSVPQWVMGDPTRLRQILLNLISNAIKFTQKGHVDVSVASDPHNMISFTIADTGSGIPKEKLEVIFKPFTQADSSTTRKFGGTGLGLTICRRLVEMMHGKIQLKSQVGYGSTFTVSLPLTLSNRAEKEQKRHKLSQLNSKTRATDPFDALQKLKILLVDDSEDNRLLVQAFLKKIEPQLVMVENGQQAIDQFKKNEFDLVLMDIQMPVMDGYEATRQIRLWEKLKKAKPTPVIALTAHAMAEESKQIIAAGCDYHLTKPIRKKRLLDTIDQVTHPVVPSKQ
ncbi:PAS domain S-box protein [Magnetococcales bacterium HHB-1]